MFDMDGTLFHPLGGARLDPMGGAARDRRRRADAGDARRPRDRTRSALRSRRHRSERRVRYPASGRDRRRGRRGRAARRDRLHRGIALDRWVIVTSAPRALAEVRLRAAGLPPPAVMVTADDVEHGKPAPDCFLLAAARLGVDIAECLVFEDAPAGIAAAEAAGADAVLVTATHRHPIATRWPTIADYAALSPVVVDGRVRMISQPTLASG
ncbi:HAD family hydrolase [Sphingomonas sp. MMS24-JH45]